jgi:DNA topoisomerase-1
MYSLPYRYILVIAEKPRAAEKIANALGKAVKRRVFNIPIWIVYHMEKTYVVASAAGHLYTLDTDEKGYPVFNYKWVPRYLIDKDAKHTYKFLKVLDALFKRASEYINACDYDIEGSLIGYMIIKNLGDIKKAKRAKFSSLTRQEIVKAFNGLLPMDFEMIEAGYCRHVLDWLWGINISRILIDLYFKAFQSRRILSAGRVQTPTLAYAVDVALQRKLHIPLPLIYPLVWININGKEYRLNFIDEFFTSLETAKHYIENVKKNPYAKIVDIEIKTVELQPPHPFNLPDLQSEAYRIYRFTPYKTQKLAEDLYLEALISYPRTNSQKLPSTLNNEEILKKLAENPKYRSYVKDLLSEIKGILKPNNGFKEDPAHPAIYPTGERISNKLKEDHIKLYELIVRRYLATFSLPARVQYIKIVFEINNLKYTMNGVKIVYNGWLKYYPYVVSEKIIPYEELKKGLLLPLKRFRLATKYTHLSKTLNRYTLFKWMEDVGIGTESTRAEIVELLYKRGYLVQKTRNTDVSDIGIMVIYLLKKFVKDLISIDLTKKFESYLEMIKIGKSKCENIVDEAKEILLQYISNIKTFENDIIEEMYNYVEQEYKRKEKQFNRCLICERKAMHNNFCMFHYLAFKKLNESYSHWKNLGYEWHDYISKLLKLRHTGAYVKEVCEYLLKNNLK